MKVKIVTPHMRWTADKVGKVYTVVKDRNFNVTGLYQVIYRGRAIDRYIRSDECRVLEYTMPVEYLDYEEEVFHRKEVKKEQEFFAQVDIVQPVSCEELKLARYF